MVQVSAHIVERFAVVDKVVYSSTATVAMQLDHGLKKAGCGLPAPWKEVFLRCSGASSYEWRLASDRIFLSAAMK